MVPLWGSRKWGLEGSAGGAGRWSVIWQGLGRGGPGVAGSPVSLGSCSSSQPGAGPTAHHSEGRGDRAECPV